MQTILNLFKAEWKMKGKAKKKRKIGKIILIGMGFFLTILLTFTTTLAWFYDSDWASKYIKMGGSVGIVIKDSGGLFTSGANNLHFNITTDLAYPGQSVDVSASCFNTGGKSGANGSECYIRARFAVYTNIGTDPDPNDYITAEYPDGTKNPEYVKDYNQAQLDKNLSAKSLYVFLDSLISAQNAAQNAYIWQYSKHKGSLPLSTSGTSTEDVKYYLDGQESSTRDDDSYDKGYFYLCKKEGNNDILQPLSVNGEAVFLWNNTFTIPWQLTNFAADKYIYVTLQFQAIQTYIPVIDTQGKISQEADNRQDPGQCTYTDNSVLTVFNSCAFDEVPLKVMINGTEVDFGSAEFDSFDDKSAIN